MLIEKKDVELLIEKKDAEFESGDKRKDTLRSASIRRSRAAEVHNLAERVHLFRLTTQTSSWFSFPRPVR